MTVAENVAFPLTVRRLAKSDIQERVTNQGESVNKLLNFSNRDKPRQLHKHALFSLKITVLGVGAALAAARSPARRYDF